MSELSTTLTVKFQLFEVIPSIFIDKHFIKSVQLRIYSESIHNASYASVAGESKRPQKINRENVSSNETATANVNKPNAVQQTRTIDMETKLAIKGRKLTAGACEIISNCLKIQLDQQLSREMHQI